MLPLKKVRVSTATADVSDQLRQAIIGGAYQPGAKLPSEKELGALFGVSRATVREALRILEEQGLIARRHGVGSFVRERRILKNLNLNYGTTSLITSAGFRAGTGHLAIRWETAGSDAARSLELPPETRVAVIERVRTADAQPVVYSLDILPASFLAGYEELLQALGQRSVYEFIQTELGLDIHHGLARLAAVPADAETARRLNRAEGSPLLYVCQIDYLADDQPVLLSHEYHIPDAFEMIVYRSGSGWV